MMLEYLACGLLMFATLQLAEAQTYCANSDSCSVNQLTCYSRQFYYYNQQYTAYHQASYSYSYSCGLMGRDTCYRTMYNRVSYTAYSQRGTYRQISTCCSGYSGSPGSCTPVCSGSYACQNGGICVQPNRCCCLNTGYSGPLCNNDCDECQLDYHGCAHNCVNTHGSYYCTCTIGYELASDQHNCTDINECVRGTHNCDQNCHNTIGSFHCSCNTGYFLSVNGYSCNDINECSSNNGDCPQQCVNTVGGFHCHCYTGYSGNGLTCTDIDECSTVNGGCEVHCINTVGSFTCSCDGHEILDSTGLFCIGHDECATGAHNCEQLCNNLPNYWQCSCIPGYRLRTDGTTCADVNECLTNNGGCAHTCTNDIGSYTCSCRTGYVLDNDNHHCIDVDECLDPLVHTCQHICVDIAGSFHCICNPGYTLDANGKTCTADPCSLTLAAPQDGTISCTGVATDENCTFTCDPGFSLFGEFVSTCQPNHLWSSPTPRCTRLRCDGPPVSPSNGHVVQPCSYAFGQTCHIACSKGYSLERGATNRSCIATPENPENPFWTTDITTFCGDVDECQNSFGGCTCEPNIPPDAGCFSQCSNTMGSYRCICTQGYVLEFDQLNCQDHDECARTDNGCEHECVNTHGTYMCICNWGYRLDSDMRSCSDIDECAEGTSGCNQTCTNIIGNYSCSCVPNLYTLNADGHACDDVDECRTNNGGCDHFCHNYYGGHECSCRPGYTLEDDGHECVADPCVPIMAPQNGSIACTSGMVGGATDDNCTFACHFGFELENANHRTCFPNHTWSGVETYCRILQCPILQAVGNGTIRLPCAMKYTSICMMDCDPGYYLVGNADRMCLVVDFSTNEVNWVGEYAECNEITPCAPNPCQHDAPCYVNGDNYYCNCLDTRYTGKNCQIGKVEFPLLGFPTVRPGVSSTLFTIFASPDNELIVTPNANNCAFSPTQITITAPAASGQFSVTCWGSGVVTVTFTLDGDSSGIYTIPPAPNVLYILPDPRPVGEDDIFEQLGIAEGSLPPATNPDTGEAANRVTISLVGDNGDSLNVTFSSTSGWCRNEGNAISSSGVAYLDNTGLAIPIALQGVVISANTLKVEYRDPATEVCSNSTGLFSAVDIQELLSKNSLANQYFDSVSALMPSWLDFYAPPQTNIDSVSISQFILSIVQGTEAIEKLPCSYLPIEAENHYIVLPYTGNLQVTVADFNVTFESDNGICFVSSVTAGASSPIFIGGFDNDVENNALFILDFMQDLAENGWNVDIGGVGLGIAEPVVAEITFEPFKIPFGITTGTLSAPNVWINGSLYKMFGSSASRFSIEITGDAYMDVPDLANILNGPPIGSTGQWICVTSGSVVVNVNSIELNGEMSNFTITGTDTKILSMFGGFPRDLFTNPAGMFFRGMGELYPDLFNQYTSDINVYITLNENNEATGLGCIIMGSIIITTGLSLDNLDIEVNNFNWSDDNPLWYRNSMPESQVIAISRPEEEIVLNLMIRILPDTGVYTEPSIIMYYPGGTGGSYTGYFNSRVNIFGTNANTSLTITDNNVYLSNPSSFVIFDSHSAYLWCRASLSGVYSWEDLEFEVMGYFVSEPSNGDTFIQQIIHNAWDGILTQANISKRRHITAMNATNCADEALTAKRAERDAAKVAYNISVHALNEASDNVTSIFNALNEIRQQISVIQPQVDSIQTILNSLCTPIECPVTCLPSANCRMCTDTIEVQTFSECETTCYEDVARLTDPGTQVVNCWDYNEVTFEQTEVFCGWRSNDYIDYQCRMRRYNLTLLSSQESSCTEPVSDYPYVADREPYNCLTPCESSPQLIGISYTCCSRDSCGMQLSTKDCLLFNHACMTFQDAALINGTHGLSTDVVTLLRMETQAAQAYNTAIYTQMIAEQMLNITRNILSNLEDEYINTLASVTATQNQLSNVTDEVTDYLLVYDYIQNLSNGNGLEIVNISFVSFQNVSDPNSILELAIEYTVGRESSSDYIEGTVYGTFDFSNENVMDIITFDVMATVVRSIVNQAQTVKRHVSNNRQKRQQIINPGSNTVLSKFQENCITLRNAEEILKDLVTSLGQLSSQYQTSYSNLQSIMNELVMQSTYTTSGVGSTMFVNNATLAALNDTDYTVNTDIAHVLGIDVTTIRVTGNADLIQAQQIIDTQLTWTRLVMENLGHNIFVYWTRQIRSMILGAQTDNCFSFGDCAILLVYEIQGILDSTPADLVGSLPSTYEQTSQEFLELAFSNNLTIVEAYNKSITMAHVIARLQNISYWCATPPNITEQPQAFGLFTVGQYYFISCSAIGTPAPTYAWWKDGKLVPDATENIFVFPQLRLSDDGVYTCVASNLVHSVRSMPTIVRVQSIPTIVTQPKYVDTYPCSVNGAMFKVNATGIPIPGYQWYFRHITSILNVPISGATSSVLFIEQPQGNDEGSYFCNVSNSRGSVLTDEVRLHLLEYEITRLSALVSFTNLRCIGSDQANVYTYNSPEPVDYSIAFFEVVVEAFRNLTGINLLDPLNQYYISENGGRVEADVVTPAPEEEDSGCNSIVNAAGYLTTVSTQLNNTLMMFHNEAASYNILFRINGVDYCIDSLVIQPDAPFCPRRGQQQFEGILCIECPPGKYQLEENGVQVCSDCPKGTYQAATGQTQCIGCPANTTTESAGTRTESKCYFPCDPGYVSVNGLETAAHGTPADCQPCPLGYYQPIKGQESCITCPEGENTSSIATIHREQCIRKCDPGCVNPESGLSPCRKCEKGQYISYMQSTFCMTCPEGQSTLSFENSSCGATNIADCKAVCLPGTYSLEQTNLAPCEECEKDTFQAHSEQNFCLPCDDLYGTVGTGAEHCLKKCGPGNYSANGFEICIPCPKGEYQDNYEQYSCVKCPNGTMTASVGTTNVMHCIGEGSIGSSSGGSSGAVIGGAVGGVVVVVVIIIVVLLVLIYMRKNKSYPVSSGLSNHLTEGDETKNTKEQCSEILLHQFHHDNTKMDSNPSYESYTGQDSNIALQPNPSYGVNKPNRNSNKDQYEYMEPIPSKEDGVTMQPNQSYGVATRMGTNTKTAPSSDATIMPNPAYKAEINPIEDQYEYF